MQSFLSHVLLSKSERKEFVALAKLAKMPFPFRHQRCHNGVHLGVIDEEVDVDEALIGVNGESTTLHIGKAASRDQRFGVSCHQARITSTVGRLFKSAHAIGMFGDLLSLLMYLIKKFPRPPS